MYAYLADALGFQPSNKSGAGTLFQRLRHRFATKTATSPDDAGPEPVEGKLPFEDLWAYLPQVVAMSMFSSPRRRHD